MSKYLDSKNPVDVQKVEEKFQASYEEAEKTARSYANHLLEEIKHYKATSYEDLAEEELAETKAHFDKNVEDLDSADISIINHRTIEFLYQKYRKQGMKEEKARKEAKRICNQLTDEEKVEICKEEMSIDYAEKLERKKREILKADILYDLMTEEQVEQYVKLYYVAYLKEELIRKKEQAYFDTIEETNSKGQFAYKGRLKTGTIDNITARTEDYLEKIHPDREITQDLSGGIKELSVRMMHDEAKKSAKRKIARVEKASIPEKFDLYTIKEQVKYAFASLAASTVLGTLVGFSGGIIADMARLSDDPARLSFMSTPVLIAIIFALYEIPNIKEFVSNTRAVDETKKWGIYDLIIEEINSWKEFNKYESELQEEHGVKTKMEGMVL